MTSLRDRAVLQAHRQEVEAEENAQREAAMQPVRRAEERLQKTARELYAIEKEAVTSGKPDPGFVMPESVRGKGMRLSQLENFHREESAKFIASTPDYFPCPENLKTMTDYLAQQGLKIVDAATFRAAFERLRYLGMLKERPEPEPEPQPEPQPEIDPEAARLNRLRDYETKPVAEFCGKEYSQRELDLLSSDEYLRVMRVPRFRGVLAPESLY